MRPSRAPHGCQDRGSPISSPPSSERLEPSVNVSYTYNLGSSGADSFGLVELQRYADALDIKLQLQYNESVQDAYQDEEGNIADDATERIGESGVTIISVSGMTCAACTTTVESALKKIKGVNEALVSLALQEVRVFHHPDAEQNEIVSAIEAVGYNATAGERTADQKVQTLRHTKELSMLRESLTGLSIYSGAIFFIGTLLDYSSTDLFRGSAAMKSARPVTLFLLTTIAAANYGQWIFKNAASAARRSRVNMHTLITASTAVGLGLTLLNMFRREPQHKALYFDTIIGVLLIITAARYMDLLSRRKATDTFAGLYTLLDQTSYARLAKLNKRVPTSMVRPGDEIIIDAFSIIPCDCYIVKGRSHVNEAVITGELLPKKKEEGDLLLAASRNGPHRLHARVNQDVEGSFLAQMIHSVESSLSAKVSVQNRIDVITQYFVTSIFAIGISAATYTFVSMHVANPDLLDAIDAAGRKLMTILAAACPCALGLATPCAVMAGIDVSWRRGILMLEGGETMERLCSITHIVLDKTGTLTRGILTVIDLSITDSWKCNESELATLICAIEERGMAAHPLAMATFRHFLPISGNKWNDFSDSGGVKNIVESGGRGVRGEVNTGNGVWRHVCIGNLAWMKENSIKYTDTAAAATSEGGSMVLVGVDGEFAAIMALQDVARPDAKTTIDSLKILGMKLSMLTGDLPGEAGRISKELGIPVLDSAATPNVKLKHIKSIQENGGKVLMIGDGMNDGPSLATADVGIMMSNGRKCLTSGGSVLFLRTQLDSIITLLDISKKTMEQVSINIRWIVAYNSIAVALAVGFGAPFGINITPPVAATMMSVSSLFITVQGLLLRSRLQASDKKAAATQWSS